MGHMAKIIMPQAASAKICIQSICFFREVQTRCNAANKKPDLSLHEGPCRALSVSKLTFAHLSVMRLGG
jgi:hypothetical protein